MMTRSSTTATRLAVSVAALGVALTAVPNAGASASQVEEIVVTAPKRERRAMQPAVEVEFARIAERTPITLTDVFQGLPSVGIRTNSRGEAVLRLRGSEERQTGMFLDGAPLSVPWDGRVDLGALPAGIVERVRVTASAAPIEYGSNSVLGVVDIQTPVAVEPGLDSLLVELGTQQSGSASAVAGARTGEVNWLLGAGFRTLGGEAVADPSVIPFGPVHDEMRDNTDLESASLFVAADREFGNGAAFRASLLSVDAKRGIANAGHIDPDLGSPRYWRYPDWTFNQLTVNSVLDLGAAARLRSVFWLQHFEQTIDQYTDDSYSALDSTERDDDLTAGMRLVVERPFEYVDLRVVGNAQVTQHDQVDIDHVAGTSSPTQEYQQNLFSIGAELDHAPAEDVQLSAALSYDVATTPKAGGRDAQDELSDWAASLAARWFPADRWEVAATLGQRTRFPSLRELYGEALGQFLLNPDLRPETATLGDVTIQYQSRSGDVQLRTIPWVSRIDDTLSRRNVVVDGTVLRQRYNLQGSEGRGIDVILDWNPADNFELRFNAGWQKLVALAEADGTRPVLYQRPTFQSSLSVDWLIADGWDLYVETSHMRGALDEEENGDVVELPSATEWDLRLFRTLGTDDDGSWRAYVGVDNITDEVVLPQLGLPAPGRTASIGIAYYRQ